MIEYNWAIINVKTIKRINNAEDVIVRIEAAYVGQDSETKATSNSPYILDFDELDIGKDYIPLSQMSGDTLVQWLEDNVSDADIKRMQKEISASLKSLKLFRSSPPPAPSIVETDDSE
jgi:hypothetical protein